MDRREHRSICCYLCDRELEVALVLPYSHVVLREGECLMSSFQKDVQLLTDLQELISDAERTANMPGYAGAVFNAISPALKAAMPAAQKKARR